MSTQTMDHPQTTRSTEPRPLRRPGPRVLLVVESSAGGTGRHVLDLAEGLSARGAEVHLIYSTRRLDRMFVDRLGTLQGVRVRVVPMRTGPHPSDLTVTRAVRRHLREYGPFDAIHGHSSKGGAIARLAAVGTGVPSFYTLHGLIMMDPGLARWKRSFYLTVERALSRVTRGIIAVSPEEQRAAVRLGLGRSRVMLVPNGIAPIPPKTRADARRALGLPEDDPVFGFVGRLVSQKAPEVLLEAFAEASRIAPRARLVMVGSGPMEAELKALAARLPARDRIHWLGERDAKQIYAAFDVFAMSSRKEGLPYVAIEAMAAGLPIVATSASGVELLVEEGVNGAVVPADDPVALGRALGAVVADPARLRRMGRASRDRASRFTIDAMVDGILAAYRGERGTEPAKAVTPSAHPIVPPPSKPSSMASLGEPVMANKPRSASLHPGPGFRIKTDFPRLDRSLMEQFREFATPDISDLLNRLYAVNPEIRGLTAPHHTLCGPACTVKVFPGDNLMVHKSLDVARPGDVVVIDAGGARTNAVLGDLISAKARHRGISGFVVDGLVRDLPSIEALDFPVFARGTTPIGPLHRGPGEINYPICLGGIVVNPGDLIVADAAGVIVVPREIAPELLQRLKQHKDANTTYFESVRRGEFSNAWVDHVLQEQHCPIVPPAEPAPMPRRAAAEWETAAWPVPVLGEERLIDGAPGAVSQA